MTPEPPTDELLRGYLLGDLPEPEAESLEQRLLADDDLFDLLETLEADLLASAGRGELPPAERDRVLRRLGSTPHGRERLAFARALDAVANRDATSAPAPVVPLLRRPDSARSSSRPFWMALAAALLLVLVGLFWMRTRTPHQGDTRPQIAELDETPAPANPAAPRQPNPRPIAPTPGVTHSPIAVTDQQAESPSVPPSRPPVVRAVLQLALTTTRGSERREILHIPANASLAELQVFFLEGMEVGQSFHVTLRGPDKGFVYERKGLKSREVEGEPALVLELPAKDLSPGRYELSVAQEAETALQPDLIEEFEVFRDL